MIFPCVKYPYTKNTNTQIQNMTKCQRDPTCGIFLKRGLFKDIKNDIPICQYKNTNTQFQHLTKCQKHPTYGIFLKRGLFKDITDIIPISNRQIQKCKYTKYRAYNEATEKTCGIFLKQLYNSSNMKNAESAQFTRSSLSFETERTIFWKCAQYCHYHHNCRQLPFFVLWIIIIFSVFILSSSSCPSVFLMNLKRRLIWLLLSQAKVFDLP